MPKPRNVRITADEIQSDLARLNAIFGNETPADQNAWTISELREMMNGCDTTVRRRADEAVAKGTMEQVRKHNGRSFVTAYRLVK